MRVIACLAAALLAATPVFGAPPPDPVAAAAVASMPDYHPSQQVRGTIRIWGHGSATSNFMGGLVARWADEFARLQPGVHFENHLYGTASAIGALAVGEADMALMGEEISPAGERLFRRARGYGPTGISVATGSLDANYFDYAHMVFVRRDNPLAQLSLQQIEGIFGAAHKCTPRNIRTWGDLGLKGEWANKPITPYGWKTDVDFGLFISGRALCGSHRWNPAMREFVHIKRPDGTKYDHGQQIVDALAKDRYGIAISNVRYTNPEARPIALAWSAKGPFVPATNASLIAETYPLVRIIPVFVDRAPGRPIAPAVAEFLRYILSRQGQRTLIEESAYLPLSQQVLLRERSKL
jgi:phosphate transport system substrate-binding protein